MKGREVSMVKVRNFQATPEVLQISRKAGADKRWIWGSFELEKVKGPAIGKCAVDR
jgi:hypothetical protein